MSEPIGSAAEARAILERGLKYLRAFEGADKALAVLDNLDQVTRERRAAVDALGVELDAAVGRVKAAEGELQAVKAKAKELVDAAAARAGKHEADAKEYAAKVVKEADEYAAASEAKAVAAVAQAAAAAVEVADLEKRAAEAREVIARAEKIRSAMA